MKRLCVVFLLLAGCSQEISNEKYSRLSSAARYVPESKEFIEEAMKDSKITDEELIWIDRETEKVKLKKALEKKPVDERLPDVRRRVPVNFLVRK